MFLGILWQVIAPICLLIALGFAVQRCLGLDAVTLTRLNFWVFLPAFLFIYVFESRLTAAEVLLIGTHFTLLFVTMFALTWFCARLAHSPSRLRRAMIAGVLFYNSGNYGIPVARLAFPASGVALQVQAVIVMLQNITNFTIGIGLVAGGRGRTRRQVLQSILGLPFVYTLLAALLWRQSRQPLPLPASTALHFLADGLVPVALITLGAQMANLASYRITSSMLITLSLRLVVAPAIGALLVLALHLHGVLAQALAVSTSFPIAVNSALIAIEYQNEPQFAAAVVFYSTLISAVTVSIVIYIVQSVSF